MFHRVSSSMLSRCPETWANSWGDSKDIHESSRVGVRSVHAPMTANGSRQPTTEVTSSRSHAWVQPIAAGHRASSGPCGKFCNAQSPAIGPRQGARRREWQALSKGCNAALAQQRGSLRAGARVPSPALRSLELALASPTLKCLVDETREAAEYHRTSRMAH